MGRFCQFLQNQKVIQLRDSSIMLNFISPFLSVVNLRPDITSLFNVERDNLV